MKKSHFALSILLFFTALAFAQKPELGVPVGHSERIFSVAFSPDGKYAVSGSEDKSIKLWELAEGKLLKTWEPYPNPLQQGLIYGVEFVADGKYVLCGALDQKTPLLSFELGRQDTGGIRIFRDPTVEVASLQPSVRALVVRLCEDLIDRGYVTSLEVAATHVGSQRFGSPRCRTAFRECLKSAFV